MNILNLFDGIACGRVAAERVGLQVDNYYSSEIEDSAMKVALNNYPGIKELGNITLLDGIELNKLPAIDLLMGGSPCQDLTKTKQDRERKGLKGSKSMLFYEYLRILRYIKPKYFLLENVEMAKEWEDIFTKEMGVIPIKINSNLVSATDRKRIYWTNISGIKQPQDKGLLLKDVLVPANEVPIKYWYDKPFVYNGDDKKIQCTLQINTHDLLKKVYNMNNKCGTLTCVSGGYQEKKVYQNGRCRKLMPIEYERLHNLNDNYTAGFCDTKRYTMVGNGWDIATITHILSYIPKIQ